MSKVAPPTVPEPQLSPSIPGKTQAAPRVDSIERSFIEAALMARPLERKLAFSCVILAAALALLFLGRELILDSVSQQFIAGLSASCLVIAFATAIAVPREDKSFCPVWEPLVYLLLVASITVVPLIGRWASIQEYGLSPAMLPGLTWFICMMSPFAVANQSAFGLGSAVPKCIVMAAVVRYSTNGDWGIFSGGLMTTPQSAMLAMAMFSALTSILLLFLKKSRHNSLMIAIGMLLTLPGIVLMERLVVMLQLA